MVYVVMPRICLLFVVAPPRCFNFITKYYSVVCSNKIVVKQKMKKTHTLAVRSRTNTKKKTAIIIAAAAATTSTTFNILHTKYFMYVFALVRINRKVSSDSAGQVAV